MVLRFRLCVEKFDSLLEVGIKDTDNELNNNNEINQYINFDFERIGQVSPPEANGVLDKYFSIKII